MSFDELINTLNNKKNEVTFPKRISSLKSRGRDTDMIEKGISQVVQTLESNTRSFIVYGEPQSGKTEFMIALTCKLVDLNYQTIFIVMNDNTELETQNFDRFHQAQELNPTPLRDTQINQMDAEQLKIDKQRIIFCRKNSKNLQKLISSCRYMKNRIVIDDEADFATPNSKINKDEVTAINLYLGELGNLNSDIYEQGTYIGVTATPARLDLNNTFLNDSKKWIFLDSHKNYKGRSFFFPVTNEDKNLSDYRLVKLPDEGDNPKLLRHAVFRFLLRVSLLNISASAELTAYSMLIHTAGAVNDHERDQQDLQRILGVLADQNNSLFKRYCEELLEISQQIIEYYQSAFAANEVALFVLQNIGKNEVLAINHKNDGANVRRAGQPNALFTFAIGGNIVSRGLTFENLLTFFFSRNVKNKLQQNTYIQRARMFGTRPRSEFFELCVPETLFFDWANCFQDHELSLRLARAGVYQHVQSGRTNVVDRGAIDNKNITTEKSERVVGNILRLNKEIESKLIFHDRTKPLQLIKELIAKNLITYDHFPESLIIFLEETSFANQKDIFIVLREEKGVSTIQNIERYKDGDPETITRTRGGIVHAMLNKRKEYDLNNHFILPIKNEKNEFRFLYKSNLGQTILQNLRVLKSIDT
ncbi:hypothetical protein N9P07_00795 [Alphaproteobacteria bacterium]|nr:hypothetical protein [Alphaproteobacteria bacterium]